MIKSECDKSGIDINKYIRTWTLIIKLELLRKTKEYIEAAFFRFRSELMVKHFGASEVLDISPIGNLDVFVEHIVTVITLIRDKGVEKAFFAIVERFVYSNGRPLFKQLNTILPMEVLIMELFYAMINLAKGREQEIKQCIWDMCSKVEKKWWEVEEQLEKHFEKRQPEGKRVQCKCGGSYFSFG